MSHNYHFGSLPQIVLNGSAIQLCPQFIFSKITLQEKVTEFNLHLIAWTTDISWPTQFRLLEILWGSFDSIHIYDFWGNRICFWNSGKWEFAVFSVWFLFYWKINEKGLTRPRKNFFNYLKIFSNLGPWWIESGNTRKYVTRIEKSLPENVIPNNFPLEESRRYPLMNQLHRWKLVVIIFN